MGRGMDKLAGILAIALAIAAPASNATQPRNGVREGQAVMTELGANASAMTYWLSAPDGWHVVTTVDTVSDPQGKAEIHAVVRFAAVLLPGQAQLISVPFAAREQQQILRIRRLDDRMEVAVVPASSLSQ
jgi:hypothetical protein